MEHVSLKSRHAVFWVQLGSLLVEPRQPGVEQESWRPCVSAAPFGKCGTERISHGRLAVPSFVEIKLFTKFESITEFYIYLIFSNLFNDAASGLRAL